MAAVMTGVDPHEASRTAVAVSGAGEPLGELRVRACAVRAERLLARQLLPAGERVVDVPPEPGARVRLLAAGDADKNDPGDARPVAVAALRPAGVREVRADDHAAVLEIWSRRHRDRAAAAPRSSAGGARCCAG